MSRPGKNGPIDRTLFSAAVVLVLLWSAGPALWQVLTSVKPDSEITRVPVVYLPDPATLRHYELLFERKPFASFILNSALISSGATILAVLLGGLAAAGLRPLELRIRQRWHLAFLLVAVFPPNVFLFPIYEGARVLGLVNHPLGLVLCYAAFNLPVSIWIIDSGLAQIPVSIDEAARLDGLGPAGRLFRIHIPLAAPSVATAVLVVFIFCWNEFLLALTLLTSESNKTVTAGIASVSGSSMFEIPWGQLTAAVTVATLPLVLLVFVFERRITAGLTGGAVKG